MLTPSDLICIVYVALKLKIPHKRSTPASTTPNPPPTPRLGNSWTSKCSRLSDREPLSAWTVHFASFLVGKISNPTPSSDLGIFGTYKSGAQAGGDGLCVHSDESEQSHRGDKNVGVRKNLNAEYPPPFKEDAVHLANQVI